MTKLESAAAARRLSAFRLLLKAEFFCEQLHIFCNGLPTEQQTACLEMALGVSEFIHDMRRCGAIPHTLPDELLEVLPSN